MRSIPSFITEKNVAVKEKAKKFGFIFPAYYNIALSGMTVITLGNIVNSLLGWRFERFFLPWNPFIEPNSMEHALILSQMDLIGFTSQLELDYLTVGWMLRKAGIPVYNLMRKRKNCKYPPVFVGGPCASANPFPLLDVVDGYFLGDAESSLPLFLNKLDEKGIAKFWSQPCEFNEIKGFWTPHALEANGNSYSSLFCGKNFKEVAGSWSSRFDFVDLNKAIYPLKQIISTLPQYHPYTPIKGKTFQLEIGRGCSHNCRFCMIGSGMFSPARFRSLSRLLELVEQGVLSTGVSKVDIFGVNLSDFPYLRDLCWNLVNRGLEISIATLRPDRISPDLIEAIAKGGQKSLTIAPETGTERLRHLLCKRITNDCILNATHTIFENGITNLKNFFLVGLPTEIDEDKLAIVNLVKNQRQLALTSQNKDFLIRADINPMVPKWQTSLKNWVYYYLPGNREAFRENLYKLYSTLSTIQNVKPKLIFFNKFLGQTWLTHLEDPINYIIESIPLKKHTPISASGALFLHQFTHVFDTILLRIWDKFKKSKWEVTHRIRATKQKDEEFTKQFRDLICN